MKFSCYKDDLVTALKAVMPAVAVKPSTPVLSGIYIKAEDNVLEVQGNNYTNGIVTKIPCSTEENGEVVVGGKKFQEFVAKMPQRTLTCYTKNNSLSVEAGGATVELLTMPVTEFPKIQALDDAESFRIREADLYRLIRNTVFAVAKDPGARPIFTGVNFDFKDNTLTTAATNTHRIAIAKTRLELEHEPFAFVVPAATLTTLISRIDTKDTDNFVAVNFTNRKVAFTVSNVFMIARLLEGQFPPYDRIIPTDSTTNAIINVAEFKQAIDVVAVAAKETEYGTIKLNLHGDMIELFANSTDIGSAEQNINAKIEGAELGIAFNYNYLTDVLRIVDTQNVNIAFNDQYSPALVTMPGDEDFQYVVTPVRT